MKSYGSGSNKEALRQVVAKLKQSLCQGDLREADTSVGIIKILLSGGPDEGKTALRLSMAVRGARKSEALELIRNIEDLYEKQARNFFIDYTFTNIAYKKFQLIDWGRDFSDHTGQLLAI